MLLLHSMLPSSEGLLKIPQAWGLTHLNPIGALGTPYPPELWLPRSM